MKLEHYFNVNAAKLQAAATNKQDLLMEIAKEAKSSDTLKHIDTEDLYKKLLEREAIGSTGFSDGIAIPHCSLDNISDFIIGILISKDGIDFQSADGKPTRLFMYIIAPTKQRNKHIRILSEISKVLRNPSNVETLLAQKNVKSFFEKFCEYGTWDLDKELSQDYSQITVHVQDSLAFENILEVFTEIQDCHISILEAHNASKYLYSLPLFSQFMNEDRKGFHRIIVAVLNTVYVNNCVRMINNVTEKQRNESKVMITTHALSYYSGSINI
ncbi:MAG: PTS sugar transporter subunit IIA [Candidatus Cloacimonetes bacterium]|nr:PTS sugar transporter subunit IIA [Candidatus Cloacimonadota bacterium]